MRLLFMLLPFSSPLAKPKVSILSWPTRRRRRSPLALVLLRQRLQKLNQMKHFFSLVARTRGGKSMRKCVLHRIDIIHNLQTPMFGLRIVIYYE